MCCRNRSQSVCARSHAEAFTSIWSIVHHQPSVRGLLSALATGGSGDGAGGGAAAGREAGVGGAEIGVVGLEMLFGSSRLGSLLGWSGGWSGVLRGAQPTTMTDIVSERFKRRMDDIGMLQLR